MSNLDMARSRVADDARLTRWLGRAMEAATRGAALTKHMLAFARRQDLKPESIALSAVVKGMVEMMSHSLDPSVRIAIDLPSDLPRVRIDRNQLELALLNLGLNARDAMPNGGELLVKARVADHAPLPDKLAPGSYVHLSVIDTRSRDGRRDLGSRLRAVLLDQARRLRFGAFHGPRAHASVWRSNAHCEPAE